MTLKPSLIKNIWFILPLLCAFFLHSSILVLLLVSAVSIFLFFGLLRGKINCVNTSLTIYEFFQRKTISLTNVKKIEIWSTREWYSCVFLDDKGMWLGEFKPILYKREEVIKLLELIFVEHPEIDKNNNLLKKYQEGKLFFSLK